jgi:hypothetical protein
MPKFGLNKQVRLGAIGAWPLIALIALVALIEIASASSPDVPLVAPWLGASLIELVYPTLPSEGRSYKMSLLQVINIGLDLKV